MAVARPYSTFNREALNLMVYCNTLVTCQKVTTLTQMNNAEGYARAKRAAFSAIAQREG